MFYSMRGRYASLDRGENVGGTQSNLRFRKPMPERTGISLVPAFFALTLFVSAALLFLVQPMFARMVLPLLGGTPAVWNTCMVFFQMSLLAGYSLCARRRRPGSACDGRHSFTSRCSACPFCCCPSRWRRNGRRPPTPTPFPLY